MNMTKAKMGRPHKPPAAPSDAVKQVRERLGMTQQELASEMKCSVSGVRRYESAHALPGTGALREKFEKLAKRAGVSLEGEAASVS